MIHLPTSQLVTVYNKIDNEKSHDHDLPSIEVTMDNMKVSRIESRSNRIFRTIHKSTPSLMFVSNAKPSIAVIPANFQRGQKYHNSLLVKPNDTLKFKLNLSLVTKDAQILSNSRLKIPKLVTKRDYSSEGKASSLSNVSNLLFLPKINH